MLDIHEVQTVAVGSTNPVKVQAVKDVIERYAKHQIEVVGLPAISGVSEMPCSEEETKIGSIQRAERCMNQGGYDLAFGLEGGVKFDDKQQCYLFGCATCTDTDGFEHTCMGPQFLIPPVIGKRIRNGEELGPILDDILQQKDTKKQGGVIGRLTYDYISRTQSFIEIVTHTIIPWLHRDLYTS